MQYDVTTYNHKIYLPEAPITSIFGGQPPTTRPFPTKTRGPIWVQVYIRHINDIDNRFIELYTLKSQMLI